MALLYDVKMSSPSRSQDQSHLTNLSKGNLEFSINTYKSLANNENLVFSPFSISVALAMTASGADGNTLTQMKDVLNLHDFENEDNINQAYSGVLSSISSNSNYTLSTANKIFVQNDFPILSLFLNTLTESYEAGAENVDFKGNADGVSSQINSWVEKQTDNNIKDLFSPGSLTPTTKLVLVNAIYFKGTWLKPFKPRQTRQEDFQLTNGETVSVPMMISKGRFMYAESGPLKSKILQLDYAGDRLVMYFILPNETDGLPLLQKQLTADAFNSVRQQLSIEEVEVKIPKFKLDFKQSLNELLAGLGMTDLFDPVNANLTRISEPTNGSLCVSTVIHQAFVDVDEQGTTAAAATAIEFRLMCARSTPPPAYAFVADHPFIFVIYDTLTNLILFMGNVDNPKT